MDHQCCHCLLNELLTCWNNFTQSIKTLQADAGVTKGAGRVESAGLIWLQNLKWIGRIYAVNAHCWRIVEEEVGPAFVEPIFNTAADFIHESDWDREIARYTSTNRLSASYMEKSESRTKFAERYAALNVWVELISAVMALDITGNKKHHLLVTGGRYIRTVFDRSDKNRHNDFRLQQGRSPGFIFLFSYSEAIYILACFCRTPIGNTGWLTRVSLPAAPPGVDSSSAVCFLSEMSICSMKEVAGGAFTVSATTFNSSLWATNWNTGYRLRTIRSLLYLRNLQHI